MTIQSTAFIRVQRLTSFIRTFQVNKWSYIDPVWTSNDVESGLYAELIVH